MTVGDGLVHLLHERRLEHGLSSRFEIVERAGHMMCRTHATRVAQFIDEL